MGTQEYSKPYQASLPPNNKISVTSATAEQIIAMSSEDNYSLKRKK